MLSAFPCVRSLRALGANLLRINDDITNMRCRYPYPVEAIRHWYIAPVGGQSPDLEPNQIGLNREALAGNTDLVPFEDRVSISRLDGGIGSPRPLFMKKFFQIVALDRKSKDALSKSPNGEVVLPVEVALPVDEEKLKNKVSEPFMIGELVILNGVLSQRYPRGFDRDL
jgi:hypothetical protein